MAALGEKARLCILGPVELSIVGTPVMFAPKPRMLLALLAVRGGAWVPAGVLIDELWGGAPAPTAAKTLQGNILRLRRILGSTGVLSRRGAYALNGDLVEVDANEFETGFSALEVALNEWPSDRVVAEAQRLENLWRGEPFDDVDDADVLAQTRHRLLELRHRLVELRISAQIVLGQAARVLGELESLVSNDPLREDYWALLIRALHQAQRRGDALAAYGRARRVLATELGIEPGPTLRALEAEVLRGEDSSPTRAAPTATVAHRFAAKTSVADPFVGRDREMSTAAEMLRACGLGHRRTLLVQGSAGIGKTRLINEIAEMAGSAGHRVVVGRNDSSLRRTYGAVSDVLEQADVFDRSTSERAPTNDELGRRLDRLRAVGRTSIADAIADAPSSSPALERRLSAEAVNRRLTEVARRHEPLIVVIEDIQWADVGTRDVIREIATSTSAGGLLLALTHRNDARSPALAELLHELDRSGRMTRMHLGTLHNDDIRLLVDHFAGEDHNASEDRVNEIIARTDGNTLLARELARSIGAGHQLPDSVRDLVDTHLARCSRHTATFAEIGGLLGRSFDPALAMAVAEKRIAASIAGETSVATIVGELSDSGLAVVHTANVMFRHDLFRDAIVARISRLDREAAHLAIVDELESRLSEDLDALVLHSVGAGDPAKAAMRLLQRARRSLVSGLVDDAIDDAESALRWHALDADNSLMAELEATLVLADSQILRGGPSATTDLLRRTADRAVGLDEGDRIRIVAGAQRRLALLCINARDPRNAAVELHRAIELLGDELPQDPRLVDVWVDVWLQAANLDYFLSGSLPWAVDAVARVEPTVRARGDLREITRLGMCVSMRKISRSRFTGPDEVLAEHRLNLVNAQQLGDLAMTAEATFGVAFQHLCRYDGPNARRHFEDAVTVYDRAGDRLWKTLALLYGAVARRFCGDIEGAELQVHAAREAGAEFLAPSYQAVADSCLAWAALRRSVDSRQGRDLLQQALDQLAHPSVVGFYPFTGFILWPAIEIARREGNTADVARFAAMLLDPSAQALPDQIERIVRTLTTRPADPSLAIALMWARRLNLC